MNTSLSNYPLFSIIIPTYNQSKFLPYALDSIISQSCENWEALIINDGSTDNTAAVAQSYCQRDSRFKVFHKENGGVASALNEGLKRASGNWICWLSSDDLFEPKKLDIHLEAIQEYPEIFFFYTHFFYLDDKTGIKSTPKLWNAIPERGYQVSRFFSGPYIHGNSIAIHRKVFETIGFFDDSYPNGQDFEMWLRVSSRFESKYINQRTCTTRWHESQTTHEFPEAGFFDSARALIEFINIHNFQQLFPFLDLNEPDQAVSAIIEAIEVSKNKNSLIHSFGTSCAIIDRLIEWLSSQKSINQKNTYIKIIKSLLLSNDEYKNTSSHIIEILNEISKKSLFIYREYKALNEARQYSIELKKIGKNNKSDALNRYIKLINEKLKFNGKSNVAYWQKIQDNEYFEKHHCYGKSHGGLNIFGDDIERIEKYIELSKDMKAVVIGCGYGRESVLIAPHIEHVYGIDVSSTILNKAKKFTKSHGVNNFTPILADKWKALIPYNIDIVYCMVVFQHITRDLVKDYIKGLADKMPPHGVFICQFADLIYGTNDAELKQYEPCVQWTKNHIIELIQECKLFLYDIDTYEIPDEGYWHWCFFGKKQITDITPKINKNKKILLVCDYFWPSIGGVESYIEDLGCNLTQHGFKVEIAARHLESRTICEIKSLKIHQFKCNGDIYSGITGDTHTFLNFILQSDYDSIILLSQPDNWASVLLSHIKDKIKSKVFILPSINWCDRERWDRRKSNDRILKIISKFDIVITATEDGHDAQYAQLNNVNFVYIPHSIEIEPAKIDIRKHFHIPNETPLIVMVANFWPVKNHIELISFFQSTQKNWNLLIIGHSVDVHYDYFEQVKSLSAKDSRIILCNGFTRENAAAAIAQADLLLVPSKAESAGPLVVQQAMRHGVPWVATYNCNGVHHQAGGIITDMGRLMQVAEVLIRKKEIRLELGRQGKQHFELSYKWNTTIQGFLALLEGKKIDSTAFRTPQHIRMQKNSLQDAVLELAMSSRPIPKTLDDIQRIFPKTMVPNNKFGMCDVNGILGFLEDKEMLYLYNMASDLPRGGTILEVGSFMGLSAHIMASALLENGNFTARIHCVDWWTRFMNKINTEYRSFYSVSNFSNNLIKKGLSEFIHIHDEESRCCAQNFADNSLDVVFIDGDHSFKGCHDDLVAWYPKIKEGGFLIGHDYTWTPSVQDAVHEFTRHHNLSFFPPPEGTSIFRINKQRQNTPLSTKDTTIFSVIVTTYNRKETLKKCLTALDLQDFDFNNFEVLVCDDGSTDDTERFVQGYAPKYSLKYFRQNNKGPAAARNMGLLAASGKYILFLNDDSILKSNGMSVHYKLHLKHKNEKIAVLGKFSLSPEHQKSPLGWAIENSDILFNYYNKTDRNLYNYHSFFTCNLSLNKQALFDIGLFDESFSAPAAEDIDLGFRLFHEGWRVLYAADCIAWHDHKLSIHNFCNTHKLRGYWRVSMLNKHRSPELKWFSDQEYEYLKQNVIQSKNAEKRIEDILKRVDKIDLISNNLEEKEISRIARELFPLIKEIQFYFEVQGYFSNPWFETLFSPLYKEKPLISVVIPCFNHENHITECVNSVINQSFQDFEIIIVNDGSTDNSLGVAYELYKKHTRHRIRVIDQKNSGQPAIPRNNGISVAIGHYILPLDADDYLLPDALETLISEAKKHQNQEIVVYGSMQKFGISNNIWPTKPLDPQLLPYKNQIPNTSLFSKSLWSKVNGYNTNVSGYEDWDFWNRIHIISKNFVFINKILIMYRTTINNSMYDKGKSKHELNIANIVINTPKIYDEDQVEWANLYIKKYNNPNEGDFLLDLKSKFQNVYANIILNSFPGIYTQDEKKWAHFIVKKNTHLIESFDNNKNGHFTIANKYAPKILFVCHDFPPYRFAGAQMYALNLAQAINQSGKGHVEILYPVFRDIENTSYSIKSKEYNGITVHELSKPKVGEMEKVYDEKATRSFELFLEQHQFDVVHFHGLGQLSFALPSVAQRKNIPTVLTLHDYWFLCDRWHMIRRNQSICSGPQSVEKCTQCHIVDNDLAASKDVEKLVLRYHRVRKDIALKTFQTFDLIQAPSNHLQKTFEQFGFPGVQVFPLGLANNAQISLDKPQKETLTFGYIGQLIRRKGINFLLDAFKEIPGDIRLLIWGDHDIPQPYQMRIRELAKQDSRVRLMGKYDPTQLPTIFSQIDVAVIPSLMENYPITALEALHYKTPVIASRTGGIPEIVIHRENGLLFEAGSVSELKNALTEIINNPDLITTFREHIKPVRTIEDDANEIINAYRGLNITQANPSNEEYSGKHPLTVQFYVYKNVHWPMFESLFEYLRGRNDVREIVICLPNLPNLTNCGTNHHLVEKILTLGARIVTDPRKANAGVTFIADTIAGKVHGCGRIVNVGHGTISKGYYFTESVWTERENWVDLLCVPGEYARERMSAILKTKVIATGMPKLDPVFSGHHTKSALCSALGLNPSKKIVLYAPTFNLSLSSAFVFADSFHRLDSPDRYVLIKLHGSTLPNLIEQYRRIAKNSRQIIFIEDNNIAPYIGGADIMISDVSSAFMEFMALNKPVILYDNPGWGTYHGYDPENIEYAWRDLGTRINSFKELPTVLDRLMVQSDGKELIRQKYAAQLFADRSGRACENVWQETLRLTQTPAGNVLPIFSVVIHVELDAHILLRSLIHDLQFYSVMPVELILVAAQDSLPEGFVTPVVQFNEFINVKLVDAPRNATAQEAVVLGVNASSGDFICVLRDDVALFKNFDYMLYKTFAAHPEIVLLTGLTNLPLPGINSNQHLANERSESPDCLAYRFINQFKGTEITPLADQPSIPPLVVFRKKSINLSAGDPLPALQSLIAQGKAAICLSLFYLSLDSAFRESLLKVWRIRASLKTQDRLKIMSDVVSHLSCPDMSEAMVRDAIQLALPKSQYRQGIANSLHTRYYDTEHKAWLSSILDANDPWARSLQADCRIIDALKATVENPGSTEQAQNKTRVMFYFFKNVHIPILFPLYHALKAQNANVEIGFSYLPPSPQIRAGLLPDEVRIIEQTGEPIHATPQEFKPDLTFIADSVYPWVEGCGQLVHVGHGVLSKGQYYTDTPTARREELADLVCVPGKHHQAIMRRIISKPVVATGMCKLDDLFSGKISRASVIKQYGLPADYRYVLFAPTFNDELSAIPFVQDRIGQVLPDDKTLLIIKLHPSTKAEYKEMYRALPNTDKRIIFADELDITPFLALCDLMISDVSSAMMEFAALDKPVILFNNPNWTSYQNYNPADIEFVWRDIGVQVADHDEMRAAVSLCLQDPGLHADKRKKYTDLLFANKREGNAAERIVKLALSLVEAEQDR